MSEDKSRASHHVEDLSVLSRRGALSAADQQAFAEALDASATLATAHQLGLDFDRVAGVKPGDDALIAQVTARVVSRDRLGFFVRFRRHALLLVAALLLAGSATALWRRAFTPAATVAPSALAWKAPRSTPVGTPLATAVAAASSATVAEPEPASEHAERRAVVTAPPSAARSSPRSDEPSARTFDSAESLFREANAARRAGDAAVARALYLRLEHDFPASDEAHLAHVSLGNLLLAMGRPGDAEQQFASYLGGRSALAQEALVGRAQSLAALGRSAEEQRVWQGLLHDYPASVYAARARQRLAELARSAGPE